MRGTFTSRGTIQGEVIHRFRRYTYEMPVTGGWLAPIRTVGAAARHLRKAIEHEYQYGGEMWAMHVRQARELLAKLQGEK